MGSGQRKKLPAGSVLHTASTELMPLTCWKSPLQAQRDTDTPFHECIWLPNANVALFASASLHAWQRKANERGHTVLETAPAPVSSDCEKGGTPCTQLSVHLARLQGDGGMQMSFRVLGKNGKVNPPKYTSRELDRDRDVSIRTRIMLTECLFWSSIPSSLPSC